ncbi:MAG: hypothetical protein LBU09_00005, partial [Endomicrobium sp.]|nr:hypothetical protein [Endomicrobium sp.]
VLFDPKRAHITETYYMSPLMKGVDVNEKVGVVDLINENADFSQDLKNKIEKKLKSLQDKKLSTKTKDRIVELIKKNISHIEYGNRTKYLAVNPLANLRHKVNILNIDTLVNNSVLIETQTNTKKQDKPNVDFYHYFFTPVRFGNKVYTVKLVGEQYKGETGINPDSIKLYDVIEVKAETNKKTAGAQYGTKSVRATTPADTITIAQMLSGVKDADGKPYLMAQKRQPDNRPYGAITADRLHGGFIIDIFERAITEGVSDATILHEQLGHAWMLTIEDIINTTDAADWDGDFRNVVKGLYELFNNDIARDENGKIKFSTAQQELFAQSTAAYVRDGKLPKGASAEVKSMFEELKNWIVDLWETLKQKFEIQEKVDPRVAAAFDYLLDENRRDLSKVKKDAVKEAAQTLDALITGKMKVSDVKLSELKALLKEITKRSKYKMPQGDRLLKYLKKQKVSSEFAFTDLAKDNGIKIAKKDEKGLEDDDLQPLLAKMGYLEFDDTKEGRINSIASDDLQERALNIVEQALKGESIYTQEEQASLEEYEQEQASAQEVYDALGLRFPISEAKQIINVIERLQNSGLANATMREISDIMTALQNKKIKLAEAEERYAKLKEKFKDFQSSVKLKTLAKVKNDKELIDELTLIQNEMQDDINAKDYEFSTAERKKLKPPDTALLKEKQEFIAKVIVDIKAKNGSPDAKRFYGLFADNPHFTGRDAAEIMAKHKISDLQDISDKFEQIWKSVKRRIESNYKKYISEKIDELMRIKDTYKRGDMRFAKWTRDDMDLWQELNRILDLTKEEAKKEFEQMKEANAAKIASAEIEDDNVEYPILNFALQWKANGVADNSPESSLKFYKNMLDLLTRMRMNKTIADMGQREEIQNDVYEMIRYMRGVDAPAFLWRLYAYTIGNFNDLNLVAFGSKFQEKFDLTKEQNRESVFVFKKEKEFYGAAAKIYGSEAKFFNAYRKNAKNKTNYKNHLVNPTIEIDKENKRLNYKKNKSADIELNVNNMIYIFTHIPDISKIAPVVDLIKAGADLSNPESIQALLDASENNDILIRYAFMYQDGLLDMWNNKMSEQDRKMSALYRDSTESIYGDLNNVFLDIYGYDLPRVKSGYFPSKPFTQHESENFLNNIILEPAPLKPGQIKSRVFFAEMRSDADPLQVLSQHIAQSAKFIFTAKKLSYLQKVYLHPSLRREFNEQQGGVVLPVKQILPSEIMNKIKPVKIRAKAPKFDSVKKLKEWIFEYIKDIGEIKTKTGEIITITKSGVKKDLKRKYDDTHNQIYS